MKKPYIISTSISKGGAGKTSLTSLMLSILADKGFKVLGIDTDSQTNLTKSFGLGEMPVETSVFNFITRSMDEDFDPTHYVTKTEYDNIDLIVSETNSMKTIDRFFIMENFQTEFYMKTAIDKIAQLDIYDFIIIDTPPNLGSTLNINNYVASDYIIVPVACDAFSLDGLLSTYVECSKTRRINPDLGIGIVMNKVDGRKNITKAVIEAVHETVGDHVPVFKTQLRVDSKLGDSQFKRIPLFNDMRRSRLITDVQDLVEEVFEIAASR